MGRPGLEKHRKFRRLARALGSRIVARGALELIWDAGYEAGDDRLGTAEDIETLVDWQGPRGALTQALLDAGQPDGDGFIEPVDDDQDGSSTDRERSERTERSYRIHDLFEHAPEYVSARRAHERERRILKRCERCANPYHSGDPKSRYCTSRCRSAAWRENPNAANAERTQNADHPNAENADRTEAFVRERDPIPSQPSPVLRKAGQAGGENAAGFPQAVQNGHGDESGTRRRTPRRPPDAPTFDQVTKLVHATLDDTHLTIESTADLAELVKRACVKAGFAYDGQVVDSAVARALSARGQNPNRPLDLAQLRRNPSPGPASDPEAGGPPARPGDPRWEL